MCAISDTLCDGPKDDEVGKDTCVRARASGKGPTPEGSSGFNAGHGEV